MNSSETFGNTRKINSENYLKEEKLIKQSLENKISAPVQTPNEFNLQQAMSIEQDSSLDPQTPTLKKTQSTPNSFDYTSLMNVPKGTSLMKKESTDDISKGLNNKDRKKDEVKNKKKSGKYGNSSSSSESRSPSPIREKGKQSPKTFTSSEMRQKSKLSSHLQAIRESIKNQKSDEEDEMEIEEIKTNSRPKFIIDATPIGTIELEGETKKLLTQEKQFDSIEKQYRVMGQERPFRTQEKNLVEKLEKFFVKEEESQEKKEEGELEEEKVEIVEDEFNFESRYFMYNPTKVCNRCKRPGHFEKWCPEDITIKCMFCTGPHRTDSCTQIVCFHCYGVGHRARDCDAPGSLLCFRCGKKGHKSATCGMLVMKEAVLEKEKKSECGDIKCLKCKRYGHAKCDKDTPQNRANRAWFDGLYKEEEGYKSGKSRENLNMKVLSRAKEAEGFEFEGALSDGSYEDLANFKPALKPKSHSAIDTYRQHDKYHRKEHKHKKDKRDYEKDKNNKKKKKRFYH